MSFPLNTIIEALAPVLAQGAASLAKTPLEGSTLESTLDLRPGPNLAYILGQLFSGPVGYSKAKAVAFTARTLDTGETWCPRLTPLALAPAAFCDTGEVWQAIMVGDDVHGVRFLVWLDFKAGEGYLRKPWPGDDLGVGHFLNFGAFALAAENRCAGK